MLPILFGRREAGLRHFAGQTDYRPQAPTNARRRCCRTKSAFILPCRLNYGVVLEKSRRVKKGLMSDLLTGHTEVAL